MRSKKGVFYQQGFVALIVIAVIGAAALLMAISSSLIGLGALDAGYTAERGQEAFYAADGCAEEGLRRLRLDPNYIGMETIIFSQNVASCTLTVSDIGAGKRRIIATGLVANGLYQRSIQTEVTLSAQNIITVDVWRETAL